MARSPRHVTIDGEQYALYRAPDRAAQKGGASRSATAAGGGPGAEAIRPFEDYSGGMGYSRRTIANGYERGQNVYTRRPRVLAPGPKVTTTSVTAGVGRIVQAFWHRDFSAVYGLGGRYVIKAANNRAPFAIEKDLGSNFSAIQAYANPHGNAMIGGSGGGAVWRLSNNGWEQSADVIRKHLVGIRWTTGGGIAGSTGQGGVTQSVLVGTDGNTNAGATWCNIDSAAVDPMVLANWAPATSITIGLGNHVTQRLLATSQMVLFVKENGVHMLRSDGSTPNITPYWGHHVDATWNGIASCVWNGKGYAAHAQYTDSFPLDGRRQDNPVPCGPGEGNFPNESDIWGHTTYMVPVGEWLCLAKYNPDLNTSYVMYGRERESGEDGYGPLVWHGAEIELEGMISCMFPCSGTTSGGDGPPRLWIFTDNEGAIESHWAPIATGGNPFKDSNYRFATTGTLWTGHDDGGTENSWTKKAMRRLDVFAENVAENGPRVRVSSSMDAENYVLEGTAWQNPRSSFGMEEEIGTTAALQIDLSGTETNPPIVRSVNLHMIMAPEQNKRRVLEILLEPEGRWDGQAGEREEPWTRYERLSALQEREDVELIDYMGRRLRVKILPGITHEEDDDPNGSDDVVLKAIVTYDEISERWRWSDGTLWGNGAKWG